MDPTEEFEEDDTAEECQDDVPKPPTRTLGPLAMTFYRHYYKELRGKGDEEIDLFMLEDFAYTCQRIRANQTALEKEKTITPGKHGPMANPRVAVIQKLEATKKTLSAQLGIGKLAKKQMDKLDRVAKSEKKPKANTPNLNLFRTNNGRVDSN